jgi:hypothetical protein
MAEIPQKLPRYRELPAKPGNPPKTAWGLFGDADDVGMFNLQTPEVVVAAAKLVRKGAVFAMNWEQEKPSPPLFGRGRFRHTLFREIPIGHHGDDVLDNFFTQASSQWDGLTHVGDYEHGFWGGVRTSSCAHGTRRLGIDHRRGAASRARAVCSTWRASAPRKAARSTAQRRDHDDDLEGTRARRASVVAGDVWLIHGLGRVVRAQTRAGRGWPAIGLRTPGSRRGDGGGSSITPRAARQPARVRRRLSWIRGFLHHWIIGRFGMAIGEMFQLTGLAADCAADGVSECFFVSAPLNIQGGTGSPPNALAIK